MAILRWDMHEAKSFMMDLLTVRFFCMKQSELLAAEKVRPQTRHKYLEISFESEDRKKLPFRTMWSESGPPAWDGQLL